MPDSAPNPCPPTHNPIEEICRKKYAKWTIKLAIIALALLIFQLPLMLIGDLATERDGNYQKAIADIEQKWGHAQELEFFCTIHPESMDIDSVITPEIRYRGIYQATVYTTEAKIKVKFNTPDRKTESILFSLSDPERLLNVKATLDGQPITPRKIDSGLQFAVKGDSELLVEIKFRGSQSLMIAPNAAHNRISLRGDWNSPSFIGNTLPDQRTITSKQFTANWNIERSNYGEENNNAKLGVNLFIAAGTYLQVTRAMNYATFFLLVFFATLLIGEIVTKTSIHPVQYLISACAPVLFYLMLLAFGEQIGFTSGYIVSAAVIVAMVTTYARMFMGKIAPALIMGAIFAAGYVLNFIILNMENMALLAGTIVLAIFLGALMLLTGRINRTAEP